MKSEDDALYIWNVSPDKVDPKEIQLSEPNETVRKAVLDSKVESLQGLLGSEWESELKKLAEEYWSTL